MALNINFQGNVVNEAGDLLSCRYQAYVPSISTWGNVKETEASQYNINYGDGDLKTQSGSVSNGEIILIVFWTGDDSRQNELELFAVVAFAYSGIDNTVQDIQLKPPHRPSCAFGMEAEGLVGVAVETVSYASLITQWTYNDCIHFQRPEWYGADVFSYMAIIDDAFSFHNEYIDETSSLFTEHGIYPVKHRVINSYNLQSVCEQNVKIRYRPPVPTISFFPANIIMNTTFDIINTSTDIDSRTTNIVYTFEEGVVSENTNNSYTYSRTASEFKTYTATQTIHWHDGFEDKTVTVSASPSMSNTPPTIYLSVVKSTDEELKGFHKATVTASDLEGPIQTLNWKIFYLDTNDGLPNPFFEIPDTSGSNGYRKIYDSNETMDEAIKDLVFAIKGTYRIEATVYDAHGLSATDEVIVEVTEVFSVEEEQPIDCENLDALIAEAIIKHEKIAAIDRAIENIGKVANCKKILIADTIAEEYVGGRPAGVPDDTNRIGAVVSSIGGSPVGESGSPGNIRGR